MTPKDVSKELRNIEKAYETSYTPVFQPRISDLAKAAADAIDAQQAFIDHIRALPTCNECKIKDCAYGVKLGETVRYNCAHFSNKGA